MHVSKPTGAYFTIAILISAGVGWLIADRSYSTQSQTRSPSFAVFERAIPKEPGLTTGGVFPTLRSSDISVRAVNATLWHTLVQDERQWSTSVAVERKQVPTNPKWLGLYQVDPTPFGAGLVSLSASAKVVSLLVLVERLYPGGNDGMGWLTATVLVPSGRLVDPLSLFASPASALRFISRETAALLKRIPAYRSCGHAYYCPTAPAPERANYQFLALSPNGLIVAFSQGEARNNGVPMVTIPYSALRPYLTPSGRTLVQNLRQLLDWKPL